MMLGAVGDLSPESVKWINVEVEVWKKAVSANIVQPNTSKDKAVQNHNKSLSQLKGLLNINSFLGNWDY